MSEDIFPFRLQVGQSSQIYIDVEYTETPYQREEKLRWSDAPMGSVDARLKDLYTQDDHTHMRITAVLHPESRSRRDSLIFRLQDAARQNHYSSVRFSIEIEENGNILFSLLGNKVEILAQSMLQILRNHAVLSEGSCSALIDVLSRFEAEERKWRKERNLAHIAQLRLQSLGSHTLNSCATVLSVDWGQDTTEQAQWEKWIHAYWSNLYVEYEDAPIRLRSMHVHRIGGSKHVKTVARKLGQSYQVVFADTRDGQRDFGFNRFQNIPQAIGFGPFMDDNELQNYFPVDSIEHSEIDRLVEIYVIALLNLSL